MNIFRLSSIDEEKSSKEIKLKDTCLYRTHGYSTEQVRCTHLSIGWSYLYCYGV
jgi:hypothetical protein